MTLTSNFGIPFYRDILLALGVCSVSKKSCSNILKAGNGSAITIVVGGAAESLSARPGTADLTLRKRCDPPFRTRDVVLNSGKRHRLGFIKLAIQHGADLVPVFSFGENDVSSNLFSQQKLLMRTPVFWDRYTNKCPMNRVLRSMLCSGNFKQRLDLHYRFFMEEGY